MTRIETVKPCQTVTTTFEVNPAICDDVLEMRRAACAEVISGKPGFISAGLHVNDARTRIANYSQWTRREDYQAMLRTDEMRRRNREINHLAKGFEPVMYDVVEVY